MPIILEMHKEREDPHRSHSFSLSSGLEVAAPKRSWWEEGNWANWERAISTARGIFRRGCVAWIYPERLRGNTGFMGVGGKTSSKELNVGLDGKIVNCKGQWECGMDFWHLQVS